MEQCEIFGYVSLGLLFSQTDWSEKAKQTTLIHQYAPTTFVLAEGFDTRDLVKSQGFEIGVIRTTYEIGTIEDRIDRVIKGNAMFGGHYGDGFVDMYRDGELIYAYSGGTTHH